MTYGSTTHIAVDDWQRPFAGATCPRVSTWWKREYQCESAALLCESDSVFGFVKWNVLAAEWTVLSFFLKGVTGIGTRRSTLIAFVHLIVVRVAIHIPMHTMTTKKLRVVQLACSIAVHRSRYL